MANLTKNPLILLLGIGLVAVLLGWISIPNFSTAAQSATNSAASSSVSKLNDNGVTLRFNYKDSIDPTVNVGSLGASATQVKSNGSTVADFNANSTGVNYGGGEKITARMSLTPTYLPLLEHTVKADGSRFDDVTIPFATRGALTINVFNGSSYVTSNGTALAVGTSETVTFKISAQESTAKAQWSNPNIGKSILRLDYDSNQWNPSDFRIKVESGGSTTEYFPTANAPGFRRVARDQNTTSSAAFEIPLNPKDYDTVNMYLVAKSSTNGVTVNHDQNGVMDVEIYDEDYTVNSAGQIVASPESLTSNADVGATNVNFSINVS